MRKIGLNRYFKMTSVQLSIAVGFVFFVCGLIGIYSVNKNMRRQAVVDAESKAKVLLDRNLATHSYFSHKLKPGLIDTTKSYFDENYFDPVWMSSNYAVREIDKYFHLLTELDYYYKESAINARNPENEANEYEAEFLNQLNENPELQKQSEVRYYNNNPYFVLLRRGEKMEEACLRCHSKPELAPADLIKIYGKKRGFNRVEGEIVSAISIRVPLSESFLLSNRISVRLFVVFSILLCLLFISVLVLTRHVLFRPLNNVRQKALGIAADARQLGQKIKLSGPAEISELTEAFNKMSNKLKKERDSLEIIIKERTDDLMEANVRLKMLSITDELTGLYNRRHLFSILKNELSRADRYNTRLSLLKIDIDDFKKVNDKFGRAHGDHILQELCKTIVANSRESDLIGRYSGEEIVIVLPETETDAAYRTAEKHRGLTKSRRYYYRGQYMFITISIGVASYPDTNIDTYEDLVKAADKALHNAKENGRNRTCIYRG